jgi:hypothetical protein
MLTVAQNYTEPCAQSYEPTEVDVELQWHLCNTLLEHSVVTTGRLPSPKCAVDRVLIAVFAQHQHKPYWEFNSTHMVAFVREFLWAASLQASSRTRLFAWVNGCEPGYLWWRSVENHLYSYLRKLA